MARWIYIIFFFSGIAGLIYEAIWSRYLKLFLGHSSYGQIWTLCIYMGGLGLGSFLAARLLPRIKNLFRAYIVVELGVAFGAFVFHAWYLTWTAWFYDVSSNWSPPVIECLKIVLVLSSTLPMAILLGMTFPLVSAGLSRIHNDSGVQSLPRLYFTNSLGAALGVLLASYFAIPMLGTDGTLYLAGSLNVLIALVFGGLLIWGGQDEIISTSEDESSSIEAETQKESSIENLTETLTETATQIQLEDVHPKDQNVKTEVKLWLLIAFGTGFTSFIYEVGWIRMLSLMMGSSTHSFDLMISAFVIGLAAGAYVATKWMKKYKDHIQLMSWVQLAMGLCALSTLVMFPFFIEIMNEANHWFQSNTQGYWLWSFLKYFLCLVWMVPTSFFAGMTLPVMTSFLMARTKDEAYTGKVYGFNTFGAICGAALAGLVMIPFLQLKATIVIAGILDVLTGVVLLSYYGYPVVKKVGFQVTILLLALPPILMNYNPHTITAGVFRGHKPLDRRENIEIRHGRTATISFHESSVHKYIKTNGKPDASVYKDKDVPLEHDQLTQAATAFIPMSMFDRPYKAAIVGFGSGVTAQYLLADPMLESLDVIEIEGEMVDLARGFMPDNDRAFNDPRITIHIDDARTFFHKVNKKYDLIISVPSNPWVSGVSSLFSHEFYHHIQRYLTDEGLLVQWLQLYEFNSDLMMSIVGALHQEFDAINIYQTPQNPDVIMVASPSKLPRMNVERFDETDTIAHEFEKMHRPYDFFGPQQLITTEKSWGKWLESVPPNSEFKPFVDHRAEQARFAHEYANAWRGFRTDDFRWQAWVDMKYLESKQYYSTLPAKGDYWKLRDATLKHYFWEKDTLDSDIPMDTVFGLVRQQWRSEPFNSMRDTLWIIESLDKHFESLEPEYQVELTFWKSLWNKNYVMAYEAFSELKTIYKIYTLDRETVLAFYYIASLHGDDKFKSDIREMVSSLIEEGEDLEWDTADLYWMEQF